MISDTLEKIKVFWKKNGFKILLGLVILFFIIGYFANRKGKGSWDLLYWEIRPISRRRGSRKKINQQQPVTDNLENANGPKDSKLEVATRNALQRIFNKPFGKIRPDFLRNPVTGNTNNLEIDCFDEELRLAVEVQGVQHYKFSPFFHKNYETFLNQKYRDELKRRMLKDNNIILIEVPYTVKCTEVDDFLLQELSKNGYKV